MLRATSTLELDIALEYLHLRKLPAGFFSFCLCASRRPFLLLLLPLSELAHEWPALKRIMLHIARR